MSASLRSLVALMVAVVWTLSACSGGDTHVDVDADPPSAPDLSAPEPAVRSYLDWVSFAYRMANSEIPVDTMTGNQYVRVDAYIELNRQNGEGLEQELVDFEAHDVSEEATSAVVTAREEWRFRYFNLDTLRYTSERERAEYETVYALVLEDGRWLVDGVEAELLGTSD